MEKTIYIAGGCFWGLEKYFKNCIGVIDCEVGYANGKSESASYQTLQESEHAETVKIIYDNTVISLPFLLELFYKVIDPTSINKQGNDIGKQYRSGIYYIDIEDKNIIDTSIQTLQKQYRQSIAIEVQALKNYVKAEMYHQAYLDKNPNGYCHINLQAYTNISKVKYDPYLMKEGTNDEPKER